MINNIDNSIIFKQLPIGNTEKIVKVEAKVDKIIGSAYDFLKHNLIPDEQLFYNLLKIILLKYYKVHYEDSTESLLEGAWAYEATAELKNRKDNKYFDEINPKRVRDIYPITIRKRLKLIRKYARMGPPFPKPIYIQEKILERIIGYQVDENSIIMVDGARRIIAVCLCKLREMKIVIITQKKLENYNER